MNRSFLLLLSLLFAAVSHTTVSAQSADWREAYERIFFAEEEVAEEDAEGIDESVMEHLDEIALNPFNINTITQEQLEELPFLSAAEINAIGYYIYRYGKMITLQELQAIPQLSYEKRQLLSYFLYCGEKEKKQGMTLPKILKYGKQELFYSGRIPLNERKGDAVSPADGGFIGYPYKHQFRYNLSYTDNFKIGLVGANDSGEPFFAHRNTMGYDFYSFYAQLKNRQLSENVKLDNLVVGRYRAAFGMGLVQNSNFSLGKSTLMSASGRIATGFRPHTSASDNNYLQGFAATVSTGDGYDKPAFQTSIFTSYRYINATLSSDSTISTIVSSGYHRTENEMKKKNSATETAIGINEQLKYGKLSAGATLVYNHLNIPLRPDKRKAYRRYFAEKQDFLNASLNYQYSDYRLSFQGETAFTPASQANDSLTGIAFATINTLTFRPSYSLSASVLHRYLSYCYTALNARTIAESSNVQDENGIFASINWKIGDRLSLLYYTDYAYFSRPKYLVSQSSNMVENTLLATWHKEYWTFTARARLKCRQYDNSEKTELVWKRNTSLRLQTEYDANGNSMIKSNRLHGLHAKLLLQYAHYDKASTQSNGFLSMLTGGLKPLKKMSIDLSAGYFNTDDYYSAIYAYERGMSYGMGFSQYYGEGMRFSLLLHSDISRHLQAALKIGSTKYFDRDTLGTGWDEIKSSIRTDIDFQIKWRI